jgi:hypothetical protein
MGEAKEPEKPSGGDPKGRTGGPRNGGPANGTQKELSEWAKSARSTLVPLLVSAVVSVGFVAFAGKAVLWTRFEAIQVPGDQVVNVVSQGEAVAVGASVLFIFAMLGALAAVAAYLVERRGRATAGMSRGLVVILGVEAGVAIWLAEGKPLPSRIVATEVLALAVAAIFWATFVAGLAREAHVPELEEGERTEAVRGPFFRGEHDSGISGGERIFAPLAAVAIGAAGYLVAVLLGAASAWAWVAALAASGGLLLAAVLLKCRSYLNEERERKRAKKEKKRERRKRRKKEKKARGDRPESGRTKSGKGASAQDGNEKEVRPKPPGVRLAPWGIAFTLALTAVIVAVPPLVLHELWLAVALGAVAILGGALWRIAVLSTTRFIWYGFAMFISVPLFGTVLLMARNIDEPKVQPMALIRNTDGPDESIQGFYVAETDDRVYFANIATEGCEEEVTPHSGRLLWVPKSEVVAISIGPLQSVEQASRSALEMSYGLTPGIETAGATVDVTAPAAGEAARQAAAVDEGTEAAAGGAGENEGGGTGEAAEGKGVQAADQGEGEGKAEGEEGEGEEEAGAEPGVTHDTRLENVGPAVRPNFGSGLRIEPEVVSPGSKATLRMSHENADVEGFGSSREGRNLRLGGRVLDIAKEPAGAAEGAEYVEVESDTKGEGRSVRLIKLAKGGPYVRVDRRYVSVEEAVDGDGYNDLGDRGRYVKVEDAAVVEPPSGPGAVAPLYLKVDEGGEQPTVDDPAPEVTLAGGTSEGHVWEREAGVELADRPLLRQAWHPDHIRFEVPEDAATGVVTAECEQLAGAPLLQVSHAPVARIVAQVQPGSPRVRFDGSRSSDEDEGERLSRRWRIDGVAQRHAKAVSSRMPPRHDLHTVELTVTDEAGESDTAKLLLLRLPTPRFRVETGGRAKKAIEDDREAIEKAVAAERPKRIEIDAYTDASLPADRALALSLAEADAVQDYLLRDAKPDSGSAQGESLYVEELAHGGSCPIDRDRPGGPANRHTDLFLLNEGVTVKPPKGCQPGDQERVPWYPPTPAGATASGG